MARIYMDHNATTPLHEEVVDAMRPYLGERFANPSSITHAPGREVRDAVEAARAEIGGFLGAGPGEIVFTSGATEADNLALKGAAWAHRDRGDHILTIAIEHKAVLDTARWLERNGFRLTVVPVDADGLVDPGQLEAALTDKTILVSVQHANSEIGTIQPVEAIGRICRQRGILFHCDATQTVGKIPFDVGTISCDLAALSGHKFYGPKGIGALYVRRRVRLEPLLTGGGQEKGRRAGTLNVPGIIGLAAACRVASRDREDEAARLTGLRTLLLDGIVSNIQGARLNGHPVRRIPNNLNVSFPGVAAEALILAMRTVALSSGSACTADQPGPSSVLKAIGLSDELAHGSLRFGLGRDNDEAQVRHVVSQLTESVERLRALSPRE